MIIEISEQQKQVFLGLYQEIISLKKIYLNSEGRQIASVKLSSGKYTIISAPRILLSIKLERRLLEEETVDHIDGDFSNNALENLQPLSREDNAKKDVKRRAEAKSSCVNCGTVFTLSRHQLTGRGKYGPFCSRKCSGRYGKSIQLGKTVMERVPVKVEYYTNNN